MMRMICGHLVFLSHATGKETGHEGTSGESARSAEKNSQ